MFVWKLDTVVMVTDKTNQEKGGQWKQISLIGNAYLQRFKKFLMKYFRIDYFFIDHHSFQGIFCFLLNSFIGITTSGNKFLLRIVLLKDLLRYGRKTSRT